MLKRIVVSVCAAFTAAVVARAGIPYVESDGVDDWLDTGFIATANSKVVVELKMTSDASSQFLFGAKTDNEDADAGANFTVHISGGKKYTVWTGPRKSDDAYVVTTVDATTDPKVRIEMDRQNQSSGIRITSLTEGRPSVVYTSPTKGYSADTAYPLAIFARQAATVANYAKMRIYSFACYENGVPVHHFVPYRSSTTVGLVDTVTGKVLTNKGAGQLTYGEDAEPAVEDIYLESSGVQWVNTGYIVKPNSKVEVDFALNPQKGVTTAALGVQVQGDRGYSFWVFDRSNNYLSIRATDSDTRDAINQFNKQTTFTRVQIEVDRKTQKAVLRCPGRNDETISFSANGNTESTPCGMAIFGVARSDTEPLDGKFSTMRFYSCRVYEYEGENAEPTLLHEYLPGFAGNEACVRDSQTGTYLYNLGAGQLVCGGGRRKDAVTVIGYEGEGNEDAPCPSVGTTSGYASGETVNGFVTCDAFTDAGGKAVTLTGWELSTNTVDNQWTLWRSGTTTNCTFVHPDCAVQLKWLWNVSETSADIRNLAADGTGGDTLVVTGRLEDFEGDVCTFRFLTGPSSTELTNAWSGLPGSVRTERGDFSFTLHEHDPAAARYLKPGTTVYVAVEATANGGTVTTPAIPVTLKSAAELRDIAAKGVQRKLTVSGTVVDAGMRGESPPVVSLWGGTTDDVSTFTQIDEADLVGGAFSLVWNVLDFDTPYHWQVRIASEAAGGTASTTTVSSVGLNSCVDAATYTWNASVATGVWDRAENWTSDTADCKGYPCSDAATARFAASTTARVEVVRAFSIAALDLSAKKLNLKFVAAEGPVAVTVADFPNIGNDVSSARYDSSLVFDGVSLKLLADIYGGICIGSGSSLVFSGGAEMYSPGQMFPINLRYKDSGDPGGVSTYARGLYDSGDAPSMPQKVQEYWFGGDALVRIGRPTTAQNVYIGQYSGGGGGTLELYGHGALTVKTQFRGSNTAGNTIPSRVNFLVPEEGYGNAPLVGLSNIDLLGGDESQFPNITSKIHLSVPKGAPLYKASGKREIPLISWPAGIVTNRVVLDACPRSRSKSYLYYTYDGNGKATGVSLHYNGRPGFVLSVQ